MLRESVSSSSRPLVLRESVSSSSRPLVLANAVTSCGRRLVLGAAARTPARVADRRPRPRIITPLER